MGVFIYICIYIHVLNVYTYMYEDGDGSGERQGETARGKGTDINTYVRLRTPLANACLHTRMSHNWTIQEMHT